MLQLSCPRCIVASGDDEPSALMGLGLASHRRSRMRTETPSDVLPDGAHAVDGSWTMHLPLPTIGPLTSTDFSPNLGHSIAMTLIARGRERMGETLTFPVSRGCAIRSKAVDPVFSDKDGRAVAWMLPDELMRLGPAGSAAADAVTLDSAFESCHHLTRDMSHARAVFRLEGLAARELLANGAPVDLSPGAFAVGDFRCSWLGNVAVAFWMPASDHNRAHVLPFGGRAHCHLARNLCAWQRLSGLLRDGLRSGKSLDARDIPFRLTRTCILEKAYEAHPGQRRLDPLSECRRSGAGSQHLHRGGLSPILRTRR